MKFVDIQSVQWKNVEDLTLKYTDSSYLLRQLTTLLNLDIESRGSELGDIRDTLRNNTKLQTLSIKRAAALSFKKVMEVFRFCTELTKIHFEETGDAKDEPKSDEIDFAYVEWHKG